MNLAARNVDPNLWRAVLAPGTLPLYESDGALAIFEDATGYVPNAAAEAQNDDRIDEEAGVIRGVKILGLQSRNTARTIGGTYEEFGDAVDDFYSYSAEALRDAIPLFEGIKVIINHPEFSYSRDGRRSASPADREAEDVFGRLVNVRMEGDGLYADHQYLKSHPFARRFVEIARRMPNVLAYSPAATGLPQLVNGRPVITKITDARSVDLVGERPGTTSSLFESEKPIMADSQDIDRATATYEDDAPELNPDMGNTLAEDAADGDPGADHFDAAFEKEVVGIWQGEGTPQEKAKKIAALAKQQEQIAGIRGKAQGAEEEVDDDDDDDVDLEESATSAVANDDAAREAERLTPGKTVAESECGPKEEMGKKLAESQAQLRQLRESATKLVRKAKRDTEKKAAAQFAIREAAIFESIALLTEAQAPVRALHVKAMANLGDTKERQQYIGQCVGKRSLPQPRSQAAGGAPLHESAGQGAGKPQREAISAKISSKDPKDVESIVSFLRGGPALV